MDKKIIGILVIGLVLALVIPIGSAKTAPYESHLFAIGSIRIDSFNYVIKGFVIFGLNNGDVILLQSINIQYDGSIDVMAGGLLPFSIHHVWYNPA